MVQSILRILGSGVLCYCALTASAVGVDRLAVEDESTAVLSNIAMPKMGNQRLDSILMRYYAKGMGGTEIWDNILSMRVSGQLTLKSGRYDFHVTRKKPHYLKIVIRDGPRQVIKGYDGSVAWQSGSQVSDAMELPEADAREFILGAHFGSYLLYPYAPGKQIEYLDTVPVDGVLCQQVRVTLDTGFQVDYFIDTLSCLELKVVTTDLQTGQISATTYEDYTHEFGVPVARKVVSSVDGQWWSTFELDDVKLNSGVMPWMFQMPK